MQHDELPKWEAKTSKYIVNDRWLKVRADACLTPDGHLLDPYYVFEYSDWANCVVLSDDNEVTLLRHYRYAADTSVLEIPGGHIDEGETPEEAIRRELEEEIGLVNADIHKVGLTYVNPANHTNKLHSFVAIGGTFEGKLHDEPGADFKVVRMPFEKFVAMIENGDEIFQSLQLPTVFLTLSYLKKRG